MISDSFNYAIEPLENGLHALIKIDATKFAKEGEPIKADRGKEEKNKVKNSYKSQSISSEIDVLVAYTYRASLYSGNINNLIDGSAALANGSFSNSSIPATINVVKKIEVNYSETGDFETDLFALKNTSDGDMDNLHLIREQFGADLVILIIGSGNVCGIAFVDAPFSFAFSVTRYDCAGSGLTFAHEIGHNLGAAHDTAHANVSAYPYGHGYKDQNWRTIMASNLLPENRINYWSNPDVTFYGPGTSVPMGSVTLEDNARVWEERAPTVANFNPKKPEATISGVDVMEEGTSETWTANVTGAAPPYSYVWKREIGGTTTQVGTSSSYTGTQNDDFILSLTVTDASGGVDYVEKPVVVNNGSGCIVCKEITVPNQFALNNNYPNPFNPGTRISYSLPEASEVSLIVFNIMGQAVSTLTNSTMPAGYHNLDFEAGNLSSGMYIARMEATGKSGRQFSKQIKMQLIK